MKSVFLILCSVCLTFLNACTSDPVKIACIGDSITEGSGIEYQSKYSYPVILSEYLGNKYQVFNCGRSSTTMLKDGDYPYWTCKDLYNLFVIKPDIVVIKLGTNDTKPFNWDALAFERDYQKMIDTLGTLSSDPKIYVCLPVPVHIDRWGINDSTMVNEVIPIIRKIATNNQLPLIDLYTPLISHPDYFIDGVHPNETGARKIAQLVAYNLKE